MSPLLAALLRIKTDGPIDSDSGLCWNVVREDRDCFVGPDMLMAWPKHSGRRLYPVPDPDGGDPEHKYDSTENMWVGPYGDLRRELLDWLIEELSK